MTTMIRPRRSSLYIPGDKPRMLEKARDLPADMLILDLEDAVAPEAKLEARAAVAEAVAARGYGTREVLVRVNGLETEWGPDDVSAITPCSPDGVLFPKIDCAHDIEQADKAMDKAGAGPGFAMWAMIETPLAVLNLAEIAARAQDTRLAGFVLGTNDLAKEMGAQITANRAGFILPLTKTIAAASAYGLLTLDGVFNEIDDTEGLERECLQGRMFGYAGKTLIHPSQIEIANRVYAPDADEVAHARAIIAAFAAEENEGKGVINVDGRMTELLHLEQAKKLVALQDAIDR